MSKKDSPKNPIVGQMSQLSLNLSNYKQLKLGESIREDHFFGTFIFPDDVDFIGEVTNVDFFVDTFNEMIINRLKAQK